jgi:histidyl-tRNA synthetase
MPARIEPRLPRGMRDILPQKMILRRYVVGTIEQVFERFGFEPLQTPAMELSETLMGKYGPEAEKLIFDARHREGKEALSLRYDLSVPLSRVVASYPELVKPFKRYQIAPVWRAERPQKGRYREFYQCDADIVGTRSLLADAEIIAVVFRILVSLGFSRFLIKLNNRKILTAIGRYAGVSPTLLGGLYRSIDKLEKVGAEGVREELFKNEMPPEVTAKILSLIAIPGSDLNALRTRLGEAPEAIEGITELEQVVRFARELGVAERFTNVDFTMVRGLEYYTGPIYETVVTEPKIGSLTGGGRYDELIGMFSKHSLPATGTTIGIERIIDVMDELGMFPRQVRQTVTQVLVTVFDESRRRDSVRIAVELRGAGFKTEVWYDLDNLGKQLKYAAAKGIPYAVIIGPDEMGEHAATLRDLSTGEQFKVQQTELADVLGTKLAGQEGKGN